MAYQSVLIYIFPKCDDYAPGDGSAWYWTTPDRGTGYWTYCCCGHHFDS